LKSTRKPLPESGRIHHLFKTFGFEASCANADCLDDLAADAPACDMMIQLVFNKILVGVLLEISTVC